MRFLGVGFLILLLGSLAEADTKCLVVEEQSSGHITCTKDDFGYTLKYDSWISRRITLMSGRYDEMIQLLCVEGGMVRETWKQPFRGTQLRVVQCVAEDRGEPHE